MLLSYLKQLQAHGQTHLAVTAEARDVLRKLYKGEISLSGDTAAPPAEDSPAVAASGETKIPRPTGGESSARAERAKQAVGKPSINGKTAEEQIASLKTQAQNWPAIKALGSLRPTLVFSSGNLEADLMFIDDAPSYHDERARLPFQGPSGEKLDLILKAMGLTREQVYLSNLCKFRPTLPGQTTNNRRPRPEETAVCRPFLIAEISIVKPKVIVALGASSAKHLLESEAAFDSLRGQWHEVSATAVRVTHHPSFLLLSDKDALVEKRKIWEEMLVVMEKLALPISEKQKGYFLPKK